MAAAARGAAAVRPTRDRAFRPRKTRAISHARSRARVLARASIEGEAAVDVRFRVAAEVGFGDVVVLVGDDDALGAWSVDAGVELAWSAGNIWVGNARVLAGEGKSIEFKVVTRRANGDVEWERGDNKKVTIASANGGACAIAATLGRSKCEVACVVASKEARAREEEVKATAAAVTAAAATTALNEPTAWSGDVRLMQANEHSNERPSTMRWSVNGLDANGAAAAVVLGDRDGGSWFEKLAVVANQIGIGKEITRDKLSACATYLRWVSTGTIKCVESGGHRRPNGPAKVGRGIFISLEQIQGAMYRHGTDLSEVERVLMRHVHPWLPSFNEEFTTAVPLTRIRDIAHRNDIPQDLKRIIKHTIQNKLHRNAGPEDLIATELVLKQITAKPGEYSEDFVREFAIFYAELKRFFNATGVFERLDALMETLDAESKPLVAELIAAHESLESTRDGWFGAEGGLLRRALEISTELRAYFCAGLSTGMRNDAPDDSVRQRHAWRQAEMALEEYAFVLLSRANNVMESSSAMSDSSRDDEAWRHAANVSALALKHIGLSGWKSLEASTVAREVVAWTKSGAVTREEDASRRMKATLQRAKRLIESHTRAVMDGFARSPVELADAFGLDAHVGATFVESIIRTGVPFQLSRTVTMMMSAVETKVSGDGFDVIVLGEARGTLVELDRLTAEAVRAQGARDIIALVNYVDGDEEISSAGVNVKGVILRQELAHLSHLAIRARQDRAPLVSALSAEAVEKVRARVGKNTVMIASASGTEIRDFSVSKDLSANGVKVAREAVKSIACETVNKERWISIENATVANSGAKAATCNALMKLAEQHGKFKAPEGFVLPFGCMESAVRDSARFVKLLDALETVDLGEIDRACTEMQDFIGKTLPMESVIRNVCSHAEPGMRLVVRSSANVEDLSGMSAAGLYESVIGVDAVSVSDVQRAVSDVWSSLYSRRAVLARRAAGVKQADARMAVFAQEMSPNAMSFVLHTRSPIRGAESVQAELCVGLGETLASGTDGTPWRFEIDRETGKVDVLAYANHSSSLRARDTPPDAGRVCAECVDYSRQELSTSAAARNAIGKKLLDVANALELSLGAAQDVEGGFRGGDVVVVQSRPQPRD